MRYGLGPWRAAVVIAAICIGNAAHAENGSWTRESPVYSSGASRVHATALRELARAFPGEPGAPHQPVAGDVPQPGGIFVGILDESPAARALAIRGAINLHNVPPELDAFEMLVEDGVLYLLGNTPRGMLHAVYEFQEAMREGRQLDSATHERGTFQIRERYFHQRFNAWPGDAADIRYISHLGASHCLVTHDWQGDLRHVQGYVSSDIFSNAIDPSAVEANHRNLRALIENCLDYGLEPALWITELPCQGGPWVPEELRQQFLTRFPAEVLSDCGTYQGKVLCFSHPTVQDFYRDLLKRFFEQFPEVSTLYVFGVDSGGEFCDPAACARCAGMSKIAQRDRLIRFLVDEGQRVRPGLRVLTTGWGWAGDTGEFLARQRELPPASGLFLAAETDGWQAERQVHDLLLDARAICRERGQTFIGYDDFHWGDDTVHGLNDIQDYPLGVGAKIRRWHDIRVDGVFDHWGGFNNDISSNSIACREFFLNPLADPESVCRKIAVQQFGDAAGALAFEAWQSLERAHAVLSNACSWAPTQWPGWYPGREHWPLPEQFDQSRIQGGEPPREGNGITYNPVDLAEKLQRVGDAWEAAYPHYERALQSMREAVDAADAAPLFYAYWWSGEAPTPTRREHLRRQALYVESMALGGREIGIHFALSALYERVRDAAAYREQSKTLLLDDIDACERAAEFFDRIAGEGDDRMANRGWADLYRAKAQGIREYLR